MFLRLPDAKKTLAYLGSLGCPHCKSEELRVGASPIKSHRSEARSVSFYGLTDSSLPRIKLHRSLDFEASRVGRVGADPNENEPLFVRSGTVVDDLVTGKRSVSIEDLDGNVGSGSAGSGSGSVRDPVVDGRARHDGDGGWGDPSPEFNVLVHEMRFDLLLEFNVEDLELALGCIVGARMRRVPRSASVSTGRAPWPPSVPRRTSQSDHLLLWVHDGRFSRDRSSHHVVRVVEVDNDDVLAPFDIFPHTNESVRLEGESRESDRGRLHSQSCELNAREWRRS